MSALGILFGFSGQTSSGGGASGIGALVAAERGKERQIAQVARRPDVARDLARFERLVTEARTPEQLLRRPDAVRVLLSASGLGDQAQNTGLVTRVLMSDLRDPRSVAQQMAKINPAWLEAAERFQLASRGLDLVREPEVLAQIKQGFVESRWREGLEQQTPGLSFALEFKARAARLDSAIKILGDPVAREVITVAYAIPREIARQSLVGQERAIEAKLDPARLKQPAFADAVARRYMTAMAQQGSGGTSTLLAQRGILA
jgi:hypothetical protein